jgi:hypothetical protein
MAIVETILLRASLIFLVLGSFAGLIAGAILIWRPHWLARASLFTNRWISTRRIDKILETPIEIDSWFYRYRRTSSAIAMAGAIYILFSFSLQIHEASAVAVLAKRFQVPAAYLGALFGPMELIVLSGAAFALLVSLLLLFRPTLFRKFEHGSNEWVSLRREMKPLEILHNNLDEFTFRHTQQIGMMLVLGSVYTLVMFTFWAR